MDFLEDCGALKYTVLQARALSGKTQEQIAKEIGVSRSTYRKVEKNPGNATVNLALKISKAVGIPFEKISFF